LTEALTEVLPEALIGDLNLRPHPANPARCLPRTRTEIDGRAAARAELND